jgi:hypothetical protein
LGLHYIKFNSLDEVSHFDSFWHLNLTVQSQFCETVIKFAQVRSIFVCLHIQDHELTVFVEGRRAQILVIGLNIFTRLSQKDLLISFAISFEIREDLKPNYLNLSIHESYSSLYFQKLFQFKLYLHLSLHLHHRVPKHRLNFLWFIVSLDSVLLSYWVSTIGATIQSVNFDSAKEQKVNFVLAW